MKNTLNPSLNTVINMASQQPESLVKNSDLVTYWNQFKDIFFGSATEIKKSETVSFREGENYRVVGDTILNEDDPLNFDIDENSIVSFGAGNVALYSNGLVLADNTRIVLSFSTNGHAANISLGGTGVTIEDTIVDGLKVVAFILVTAGASFIIEATNTASPTVSISNLNLRKMLGADWSIFSFAAQAIPNETGTTILSPVGVISTWDGSDTSYSIASYNRSTDVSTSLWAVDIAAATVGLYDFRGSYSAAGNVFPSTGGSGSAGAINKADVFKVSVGGTLGGVLTEVGAELISLVNTPGQTAANWLIIHTGNDPAVIIQTSSYRFVTDAEKTTWNAKQAAISSPTNNNIVLTNGSGQTIDSGKKIDDSGTSTNDIWSADKIATAIATGVVGLYDYRGVYDASGNVFPSASGSGTAGAILKGDVYNVSVGGTMGGELTEVGAQVIATVDTPGQTAANWLIVHKGNNPVVIIQDATHRFATDAEKTTWDAKQSLVSAPTNGNLVTTNGSGQTQDSGKKVDDTSEGASTTLWTSEHILARLMYVVGSTTVESIDMSDTGIFDSGELDLMNYGDDNQFKLLSVPAHAATITSIINLPPFRDVKFIVEDGSVVTFSHTAIGSAIAGSLVSDTATTNAITGRATASDFICYTPQNGINIRTNIVQLS